MSSFKEVANSEPYKAFGIKPTKLECIGHVQKRLGNRLRSLRNSYKNTATPLSGRGKLTDKVINSFQNYFGLAIRQNQGQLYAMKKAVGAVLWHCTDFDDNSYRHRFCPTGETTWCKWQREKEHGVQQQSKTSIPKWIHDLLKPIFEELSSDELLSRCLHGQTQNANECLNGIIWSKCPKNIFIQRDILEIGVNSAIIEFNDGPTGIYNVLKHFKIRPGTLTKDSSIKKLMKRIKKTDKLALKAVKNRRKKLRSMKKGFLDSEREKEGGESYVAGGF